MDEMQSNNRVRLCGVPVREAVLSHENRGRRFFTFPVEIARLSGAFDRINVILPEDLLPEIRPSRAGLLSVAGQLRSFNNKSGQGSRLVISVYAREIGPGTGGIWENSVELEGTLCRSPTHRITPMGREIADMILAVNRPYGRSDYLPCIAWGRNARRAAFWSAGQRIRAAGRIQSREYIKNVDGEAVARTAYEVSLAMLEPMEEPQSP